jgi:hypothetical protein
MFAFFRGVENISKPQQIPITEGNIITDLIPPKGAKLPDILKNDQIDFMQGPYASTYFTQYG